MNDQKPSTQRVETTCAENHRAANNDGPDETPLEVDLYHDEGRRNVVEDPEEPGGQEKGDDL